MKKMILLGSLFLLLCSASFMRAQNNKYAMYAVGFYNQENLFDTIHDEGKNDYDFLPNGSYQWNTQKYTSKLKNMAYVLGQLGTPKLPMGAAVIGLAEVENDRVLNDLVQQPGLKEKGMKFVHIEGPDKRGIDCALLYNPKFFTVEDSKLVQYVYEPKDSAWKTRGFLVVGGQLAGEHVYFVVNHWPSRGAVSYYRERAGAQVKAIKDSLQRVAPNAKLFIMGDLNDDPFSPSVAKSLGARREIKDVEDGGLYNPWWDMLAKKGQGTLKYRGKWNLFDQIIMSKNLLDKDYSTLKFFRNEIFSRDWLFQTEGKYKGYTKRTTAGGVWINGYSDHLPVVVYLVKQVQ